MFFQEQAEKMAKTTIKKKQFLFMINNTVLFCIQEQEGETTTMYVCNVLVDKINTEIRYHGKMT